ncbi:hypothetical protein ABHO71_003694 [Stenotrophomonas maltophilia]|uniref:DUF6731 family protein n=1 Tax=Stenotrophomonas maltophilia TaxID=40324 RepID=UPI00124B343E|nr:DUF6731 family protein [Stenotrophomonas maltophilia]HEL5360285.1 hypothetical protein [Stenotrophomonas maltophilia]
MNTPTPLMPHLPSSKMRIQKFRVARHSRSVPRLETLLTQIDSDQLSARTRQINNVKFRLEDATLDSSTGWWLLNFVRNRTGHGPGKFHAGQSIQGFNFAAGESFAEDTAALYDPATRFMYIQYNHTGVRHSAMATYLSIYSGHEPGYSIRPKLDLDAERRFQKQDVTRRVDLGFDLTKMSAADRIAGNSLTQVAEIGGDYAADRLYITLTISAKDPRKTLSSIKNDVLGVLPLAGLFKATAYGGDEPEVTVTQSKSGKQKEKVAKADFEPIDLLEELIEKEVSIALDATYRMPLASRYDALKHAARTI